MKKFNTIRGGIQKPTKSIEYKTHVYQDPAYNARKFHSLKNKCIQIKKKKPPEAINALENQKFQRSQSNLEPMHDKY